MSSAKRSNEPIVWFLFGAGGFIVAYLLPVHIFLHGLALPLGWLSAPSYATTLSLFNHPLARIYLFILLMFAFFHAAHRMRLTLSDVLNMRHLNTVLAFLCYGGAIVGTVLAFWLVV